MPKRRSTPKPKVGELTEAILASELEHQAAAFHSPAHRGQLQHLTKWLDLNAYAMQVAGEFWEDQGVGGAARAYSIIHSQWVALVRSVMSLNDQGRYGPAAGLMRTVYERTDLMTYLCHFPADAKLGAKVQQPLQLTNDTKTLYRHSLGRRIVRS